MSEESEIRDLVGTWFEATKAGDTEAVLGLMTDDAVFLVPGKAPFGKEEFRKSSEAHKKSAMQFVGQSEILELKILGEWAFMVTKLSVTGSQPGKTSVTRTGHTLTILRKENGKWLLARDANLLSGP